MDTQCELITPFAVVRPWAESVSYGAPQATKSSGGAHSRGYGGPMVHLRLHSTMINDCATLTSGRGGKE